MSIKSHTKIQSIVKCVFKDDDPRIPLIEKSGFGWVRNIKPFHLDTDLISFLYSKHTKTCFELAEGKKFMISLEDVAHLTGLCIAGKQIVWKEDKNSDALCEKHLGKVPNKEDKVRCDVFLSWLVTIFNDFNSIDMPSEIEVERSARVFILLALGMSRLIKHGMIARHGDDFYCFRRMLFEVQQCVQSNWLFVTIMIVTYEQDVVIDGLFKVFRCVYGYQYYCRSYCITYFFYVNPSE